jgi:DNA-binding MarR family transcriptional regulator
MEKMPIGLTFKQIHNKIVQNMNNWLKDEELTLSQMAVLEYILGDEKTTLKAVENKFKIQHSTAIGILKRLSSKGYIEYFADEKDKRCRIIRTTEKAYKASDNVESCKKRMDNLILKGLSEEEINDLNRLLSKVLSNISGEE